MNIIYRHYQEGDDAQLADLFVRAFQMNGIGFIRTEKSWNWRYVQSPNFDPEMCQIAEDKDNNKIVGAVIASPIEKIPINGKDYLTGEINDVSCLPDYTGNGIANKCMELAIDYMKKRNCDISLLTAAYNGFPRKRIYLKVGFKDIERDFIVFHSPSPIHLAKNIPATIAFFPVLFTASFLPRLLNRIRFRLNPFFKDVTYEIFSGKNHFEYIKAASKIMSEYNVGFPYYDKKKIIWHRIRVPSKRYNPTYILIKKNEKIIGGSAFTYQNLYSFKLGIKIRVGVIHELFLEKKAFNDKRNLHLGYIYLLDKLLKATTQKHLGGMFFHCPNTDYDLRRGLRGLNFFMFNGGAIMIKSIKENIKIPRPQKPFFVATYTNTLY